MFSTRSRKRSNSFKLLVLALAKSIHHLLRTSSRTLNQCALDCINICSFDIFPYFVKTASCLPKPRGSSHAKTVSQSTHTCSACDLLISGLDKSFSSMNQPESVVSARHITPLSITLRQWSGESQYLNYAPRLRSGRYTSVVFGEGCVLADFGICVLALEPVLGMSIMIEVTR